MAIAGDEVVGAAGKSRRHDHVILRVTLNRTNLRQFGGEIADLGEPPTEGRDVVRVVGLPAARSWPEQSLGGLREKLV